MERRAAFLMREQETLTECNADLSRQVTVLLTQVEAARAGVPPPPVGENLSHLPFVFNNRNLFHVTEPSTCVRKFS